MDCEFSRLSSSSLDKISFFSCSSLNKISFLNNPETSRSDHVDGSRPFDWLPDELLTRIFSYIPPTNMFNFYAFIALETVSKRFQRCVDDNRKILTNTTELMIGCPPDISVDQCLCVIGPISLFFLLRSIHKITKVVINNDLWLRVGMMKHILPMVDRFVAKFQTQQMIVAGGVVNDELLIEKLIFSAKQSLETFHFCPVYQDQQHDFKIDTIFDAWANCAFLKNLKMLLREDWICIPRCYLLPLGSLESLEIEGFSFWCIVELRYVLRSESPVPFHLRTLRFTRPNRDIDPIKSGIGWRLRNLKWLLTLQNASSIRELEFHHCDNDDQLTLLPHILDGVNYLDHFKLAFMPNVVFTDTRVQKVLDFLANVIDTKDDFMKISLTFQHTDMDQDAKLAIVHNLLELFDVPHSQKEVAWEFIREKVCIEFKVEKVQYY